MKLEARVKAGQPEFLLRKTESGFEIHVRSQPKENKANMEIIRELRRLTGRQVRILSGLKSKNKAVEIDGMSGQELDDLL